MNDLQSLIIRGMRGFFPASDVDILRAIADGLKSGRFRIFVKDQAAFCILALPQTALDDPQVLHFYAEKPALRHALVSTVLAFVRSQGYNKLIAINGSGKDDEVWTRAFRHEGWRINPVKTVFEFEVEK
jgi:hypothetical protein